MEVFPYIFHIIHVWEEKSMGTDIIIKGKENVNFKFINVNFNEIGRNQQMFYAGCFKSKVTLFTNPVKKR